MKNIIYALVALSGLLGVLIPAKSYSQQPNEITTIKIHDKTHLKTREEYTQKFKLPQFDRDIESFYMNLMLECPDKGCSAWDYSINLVLRTQKDGKKQDFQLGRMITPYSGQYNQGKNAKNWHHIWQWNIIEYVPLMKDSAELVIQYEGYQDGFTASVDFEIKTSLKKQNPYRRFIDARNIYYGYYPFGRVDSTIDMFLPHKTVNIPDGTKKVLARLQISGHGGDSLNAAAEFLKKKFILVANNNVVCDTAVWRNDCGCNPIQPQGGTWIYNRAGWCPGTKVQEHYFDLTPFVSNGKLDLKMFFEYYNGQNSGDAGYQIACDVFFLGDKGYRHKESDDLFGAGADLIPQNKDIMHLPADFNIVMKTNNDPRNSFAVYEGRDRKAEGHWTFTEFEKKLYERSQTEANREYIQKVSLKNNLYLLEIKDEGCDGLSWWANQEQGEGYILIYNKDMTQLLDAVEPDFGCRAEYKFFADESLQSVTHNRAKLVMLQDKDKETLRIIFFNKGNEENELQINIVNRKTKEEVSAKTFGKKRSFDEIINYQDFESGYYRVEINCGEYQEYKMFWKK